MTTQLSTKFTALAVALIVNCAMIGGVAYLFSGQLHDTTAVQALAQKSAPATPAAV
ncbi:MAG: hypothetical protein ABSH33_14470 [Steroidobacteraceae bacterium]|jgi:hypothetical protein